jgi:hypothetical protein
MIIGIGKSPLADFVNKNFRCENVYAYPEFFDNKVLLLEDRDRAYIHYIKLLIRNLGRVRIALWPDYTKLSKVEKVVNLGLLKGITFIVPVHSLSDLEIVDELRANNFNVYVGYASDKKFRDYEIVDFLREAKRPLWYLGVSTKKELRELLFYGFDGFDITGYLFGTNEDRKDPKVLKRNLEELLRTVSKPQGRQTSLYDFLENRAVNWGV